MSDQELDAAVIKATQQSLGKYIKKPPLTEKLLKKPPFRYLMDIFTAFIRETGCFEGLYTPEEQLFENINDRNAKTRFLQKMIDVTKLTTKRELKVRTSKIVAGHEPKLTNELLQAMASVMEQQLDWRDAVQQVLASDQSEPKPNKSGDKPKASSKQTSPTAKEQLTQRREKRISPQEQKLRKATDQAARATPTEKAPAAQQRRPKASPEAPKPKPKLSKQSSKQKSPSPVKPKQQASTEGEQASMSPAPAVKLASPASSPKAGAVKSASPKAEPPAAVEPVKEPPPSTAAAEPAELELESRKSSSKSRRSSASQRQAVVEAVSPDPAKSPNEEQSTALASTQPADANNNSGEPKREREGTFTRDNSKESNGPLTRPRTSLRPPSARPASARPGAPRRRNVEIVLQPNDQLKMNGINVKLETFGDFDDDGENLVVIEDAHAHDIDAGTASVGALDPEANQGRLVQQILETQKELVQQGTDSGKEESQQKPQSSATRQSSARQMNDLRDIIQTLTKSVNPLGKLLDFIPEDIDAMQLELSMWRETYTQAAAELKRERSLTASATEPMKQQLVNIEASIGEFKELVDESRHKILQNNERILKMLMEQ
ncbi:TRAF3-interacting protein 1 [Drosophila montana]|uniref:TRAF3-interacting protein 1 n=1 Tax=Drosophila montana TaxID=40370 RepID=UPI00313C1955